MKAWNRHIGAKGFSLVELFVALLIVGILIAAGLPSFLGAIQRSSINGATRQVMYEIRAVQNLAVTRGNMFGFHWGGDPFVGLPPSQYRTERNQAAPLYPCASWPAPGAAKADPNPDVITDWFDLAREYPGITIQSVADSLGTPLGGVMFNSRGASMNTCNPGVTFPVTVTVADNSGATRTITIQRAGRVTSP